MRSVRVRPSPYIDYKLALWGLLSALVAGTAALCRQNVCLGQGALATALPLASAWRIGRQKEQYGRQGPRWAALGLQACVLVGLIGLFAPNGPQAPRFLAAAALLDHAIPTLPIPTPRLPLGSFIPYWPLLVVATGAVLGGEATRLTVGVALGRLGGWPLVWAGICAAASTIALVGWSWHVQGDHGHVQDFLGSILTPGVVVPFAAANALREELEFRMLTLGALLAGPAAASWSWVVVATVAQAAHFAVLHYIGGFPSGLIGFAMVLVWGGFLSLMRIWTGGMGLVGALHFQADVVIFLLVVNEARKRREHKKDGER